MSPAASDPNPGSDHAVRHLARLNDALARAAAQLLEDRNPAGHWTGHLSNSALSTATAITALQWMDGIFEGLQSLKLPRSANARPHHARRIRQGIHWLCRNQNKDGGWGDTTLSRSNISTTTLCWAALSFTAQKGTPYLQAILAAERWLIEAVGLPRDTPDLPRDLLAKTIIDRYGKDRTFSVPILTMCALTGQLGFGPERWDSVIPLPFELAVLPHQFFAALRLPVVSYALPALIAIGQARFLGRPPRNPLTRILRALTRKKSLRVLESIQPASGGFLEATPLTSFVTMSLAAIEEDEHPVALRGEAFLVQSQREDGSWPIDSNLATWTTTLAVNALGAGAWSESERAIDRSALIQWLLKQHYQTEHPYTHAAPGGWAWTDLPGGVPDADDTAGAVLALKTLSDSCANDSAGRETDGHRDGVRQAARAGIGWLLDLQNRDGGIPTFCRGWTNLPFDRSSADITAHALLAWMAWKPGLEPAWQAHVESAIERAIRFLGNQQAADGSWVPLWFGNQHDPREENRTYGTSRVVRALAECLRSGAPQAASTGALHDRGVEWLATNQNTDGGWGGRAGLRSSVEETALAVEALAWNAAARADGVREAVVRGAGWLADRVEDGTWTRTSPIGFYFAKLWYAEALYPKIFTVAALRRVSAMLRPLQM